VKFSFDESDLNNILGDDKMIPAAVRERLLKAGFIWIHRFFQSGKFYVDSDISKMFTPAGGSANIAASATQSS